MKDLNDYSRSRPLATVTYDGLSFGIVRQRINGKPWRKYLVGVFNGRAVAGFHGETDPAIAAQYFQAKLESVYPPGGRLCLKTELAKILETGADC